MKAQRLIKIALLASFLLAAPGARAQRSWTCSATIFLNGTNASYTPPSWPMRTGHPDAVPGDRERSCKNYVERRLLTNAIWSRLNLSDAERGRLCHAGNSTFRIEYGFDRRPKSWQLTKTIPAPWTAWIDLDDASGNGDFETIQAIVNAGQGCARPFAIQCQTLTSRPSGTTGQVYTCATQQGGVCDNRRQPDGRGCMDYRVRLCC